jgi:hypothetical protein
MSESWRGVSKGIKDGMRKRLCANGIESIRHPCRVAQDKLGGGRCYTPECMTSSTGSQVADAICLL